MAHITTEQEPHKRKKIDAGDTGGGSGGGSTSAGAGGIGGVCGGKPIRLNSLSQMASSHPPHPGTPVSTPINYFSRASYEKLGLVQGEGDIFGHLLKLLSDYEGVLARQESLAFNLGAKLTGPRLMKAVEGAFEGPILTSPPQTPQTLHPVRWSDIIHYARSNPGGFATAMLPGGGRVCQFHLKGMQVEVMEDDWRLIGTGALDGMIPTAPLEEDEAAELATVDIVEARLEALVRTAEEVARRAKQLVYALGGRRSGILAQRGQQQQQQQQASVGVAGGFQAVNNRKRKNSVRGSRAGIGGDVCDLHAELIQQFNSPSPSPNTFSRPMYGIQTAPGPNHITVSTVPTVAGGGPGNPNPAPPVGQGYHPMAISPTARFAPIAPSGRLPAQQQPPATPRRDSAAEDAEALHRPLITSMIETLGKGDEITPPCDRCRRLRAECVKHLTACQGCTKKHAKCTWKTATEEEIAELKLRREMRRRAAKKAAEGSGQGVGGMGTNVGPGTGGGGGGAGVSAMMRGNERNENKLPSIQQQPQPPPPPSTSQPVLRQDLVSRLVVDDQAPPHRALIETEDTAAAQGHHPTQHHGRKTSGSGNREETPSSRMDIDSITTQTSPPRKMLPTGLPRDPNFLSTPVKEMEMKEVQVGTLPLPSPVATAHGGHP